MALLLYLLKLFEMVGVLLQVKLVDHHLIEQELELLLDAVTTSCVFAVDVLLNLVSEAVQGSARAPGLHDSHQVAFDLETPGKTLEHAVSTPASLNLLSRSHLFPLSLGLDPLSILLVDLLYERNTDAILCIQALR